MALARVRGVLLRFVRRRRMVTAVGVMMAAPAAWLELVARPDVWWLDGLALLLGATGVALVWTGLTGPRPDWTEGEKRT